MTNLAILRRKLEATVNAQTPGDRRYLEARQTQRNTFIDRCYEAGGEGFLERVRTFGCTEKGDKIKLSPWYEEYLRLIGDFRIQHLLTTGPAQCGKAQPLDAKVLTPTGWVKMGDIQPGDRVIAQDGTPTKVLNVFPQGTKDIYRITFDDGSSTECCEDHLWLTQTADDRQRYDKSPSGRAGTGKTLAEIIPTIKIKKRGKSGAIIRNHTIPLVQPIKFNAVPVPLDPYLLGILIGDGCLTQGGRVGFATADDEILHAVKDALPDSVYVKKFCSKRSNHYDYSISMKKKGGGCWTGNPIANILRELGLQGCYSHQKFIPDLYKYNSVAVRLAVLQGIMDSDGSLHQNGTAILLSNSERLMSDVMEVVRSLGGLTSKVHPFRSKWEYKGELKQNDSYYISLRLNGLDLFRLQRKQKLCRKSPLNNFRRYIDSAELIGQKSAQCILIDHPSHLYVTDDYIVTHNTLGHTLLMVDCITTGKLNSAWFYESRTSLDQNVPMQFHPVADFWIAQMQEQGIRFRRGRDRSINTRYQVDQVNAIFSYVSTSRPSIEPI